jgi:SNF2 family DNA or RNA helicase
MSMPNVLGGQYDIYLTTYEMLITMEAFFTENFLWHTITIDEGHRIKNDGAKLVASLARISAPFRLLLTGTPLQNNLNELWSLMHYILPVALKDCKETFEQACVVAEGQLDKTVTRQARALLESMMLRRVKADVEASLRPKIQYVLKVPLSGLQRKMYRLFLDQNSAIEGLASKTQIISMCAQLQKTINHPKTILFDVERRRKAARELVKKAAGAEFFSLPECLQEQSASSKQLEQELGLLQGRALVAASGKVFSKVTEIGTVHRDRRTRALTFERSFLVSGKLQLLDRLLTRVLAQGSRVLVFSQYTLTLDALCEYCAARFGPEGQGYLRLDGQTNRIKRVTNSQKYHLCQEMNVRAFNAPDSLLTPNPKPQTLNPKR